MERPQGTCVDLGVEGWIISTMVMCNDISTMVMCNDIVTTEHDERRPGLPNAPLHMKRDNNRTEESTAIALNIET